MGTVEDQQLGAKAPDFLHVVSGRITELESILASSNTHSGAEKERFACAKQRCGPALLRLPIAGKPESQAGISFAEGRLLHLPVCVWDRKRVLKEMERFCTDKSHSAEDKVDFLQSKYTQLVCLWRLCRTLVDL